MGGLEAKMALRSFQSARESSFISFTAWLTLLGISVGVMSLMVVMSVMNGFEKELRRNIIDSESHILLYRKQKGIKNWRHLKSQIAASEQSIQGVLPLTYNEVLFIHNGRVQGGVLEGVEPETAGMLGPLKDKQPSGANVYVGTELALKLNIRAGDSLQVLIPDAAEGASQKIVEVKVAGTFESGLYEYSSRYVYADLAFVQKHLGWRDRVSAFKVRIGEPERAVEVSRIIREKISFPFFVKTWMHINQNIFLAIKIEKVIMAIILACIIGVALFNVVSSLIMIVAQKTKEISILKILGMRRVAIQNIFLWQGGMIGMAGTVIGLGLAFGLCALLSKFRFIGLSPDIYYLSFLPVEIRFTEAGGVLATMIVVSLAASFFPARKAALLYPIEGIRYE